MSPFIHEGAQSQEGFTSSSENVTFDHSVLISSLVLHNCKYLTNGRMELPVYMLHMVLVVLKKETVEIRHVIV